VGWPPRNIPRIAVTLKTPLVLVTDDDLVRVSEENPGYQFERERDGSVTVSPTSPGASWVSQPVYLQRSAGASA
jgi:hypothetical protein